MAVSFVAVGSQAESSGDATTLAVSYPATILAGDLLIAHVLYQTGGGDVWTTPSGWTAGPTERNGGKVFYKIATGSESGSQNFTQTGIGRELTGRMIQMRGTSQTDPIDVSNSATSLTVTTLTPTVANTMWLLLVGAGSLTGSAGGRISTYAMVTDNPSWTEMYDQGSDGQLAIGGAYSTVRPQAHVTGDCTAAISGTHATDHGIVLALRPAAVEGEINVLAGAFTTWATSTTVVITKPALLTAGDLLFAAIGYNSSTDVTTPAGWTSVAAEVASTASALRCFYKVADSADVAASNFTFTLGASVTCAGVLLRINNTTGVYTNGTVSVDNSDTCIGSGNGITPTSANSLLIMATVASDTGVTGSTHTIATSNPTWVEMYDRVSGGGFFINVAYAIRPQVTATGAWGVFNQGGGPCDWAGQLMALGFGGDSVKVIFF